MKIVVPYIGKALSVNYYKIVGKGGVKTNKTRPEVVRWMEDLALKVQKEFEGQELQPPITISIYGKFVDNRCPDLDNLAKVILDAVSMGTGLDDKDFQFRALGYSIGWSRPVLEITIEGP